MLVELAAGAPAPAEIASASVPTSGKPVSGENFRAEVERRLAAGRKGPEPVAVPPSESEAAAAAADHAVVSAPALAAHPAPEDRKSDGSGKRVEVRVDLGGRR